MAQRFGKSPALDYLGIDDPVLALLIDDALHQRLVALEERQRAGKGRPMQLPPGQRYASDADYDDGDWVPPPGLSHD